MNKHTPGPWACVRYSKKRFGLGQRGNGAFFLLQCVDDDTDNPAARADARLIAAAPDLLEALEWAVSCLHFDKEDMPEAYAELRRARAAIETARGK